MQNAHHGALPLFIIGYWLLVEAIIGEDALQNKGKSRDVGASS
jgi:hypothetical protein